MTDTLTPQRSITDVITGLDELTGLEWLNVVRQLDMPSHAIQGDLTIAAMTLATVEHAREHGFWVWDKYEAMTLKQLLEHLDVDTTLDVGLDATATKATQEAEAAKAAEAPKSTPPSELPEG